MPKDFIHRQSQLNYNFKVAQETMMLKNAMQNAGEKFNEIDAEEEVEKVLALETTIEAESHNIETDDIIDPS